MKQSFIIEIDGIFVGAAAFYGDGYTFVGVHSRLKELDGRHFDKLSDVQDAARQTYRRGPPALRAQSISFPSMPRA